MAPVSPSHLSGELLSGSARETVLSGFKRAAAEIRSFRVLSRTSIDHKGDRTVLRQILVFAEPVRFRIEALPLNGAYTLSLVVADSEKVIALDPEEKTARQGAPNSGMLRKVLNIPLNEDELMALLAGRIPARYLSDLTQTDSLQVYQDEMAGRFFILSNNQSAFFELDARTGTLLTVEFRDRFSDKVSLRLEYSAPQTVDGVPIPTQLLVSIPRDSLTISLGYSNVSLNRDYPAQLFSVSIPDGYSLVVE
jgi:hypothetical protein